LYLSLYSKEQDPPLRYGTDPTAGMNKTWQIKSSAPVRNHSLIAKRIAHQITDIPNFSQYKTKRT